jgi:NitT/TauT family transport system substrate-binding protein
MRNRRVPITLFLAAALLLGACGGDDDAPKADDAGGTDAAEAPSTEPVTLRLGMFPNVTHAPGLVGVEKGIFEENLADNVTLEVAYFNAGPEAVEALFGDALDISYIGPNPAINAFAKSDGEAIRIIAGSTSGGASLVVKSDITSIKQLKGKKVASPQLGNTQDVALRSYLKEKGLSSDTSGGGDVSIVPQANADTLTAFKAGDIAGAWVPEPWATRLVQEGGGKVLVDEATLWPGGKFVTTHVIVRTAFLDEHPDVVKQFLEGHIAAVAFTNDSPAEAQKAVNAQIEKVTQKPLADAVIQAAWKNLEFTTDPISSSLAKSKSDAVSVGVLEDVNLKGIYALDLLNALLKAAGEPAVKGI